MGRRKQLQRSEPQSSSVMAMLGEAAAGPLGWNCSAATGPLDCAARWWLLAVTGDRG